jgi:hypothetical protein
MCSGCAADPNTGSGILFYDTGPAGSTLNHNPSGGFTIDNQVNFVLQGASLTTTNALGQTVPAPPYYDILFYEDRTADANTHQLGKANSNWSWIGSIYITNTLAIMHDPTHVQQATYSGSPSGNTVDEGEIIVGQWHMSGGGSLTMNLRPYGFTFIRQVALVGGGPHP